jgi:hypothetical protein
MPPSGPPNGSPVTGDEIPDDEPEEAGSHGPKLVHDADAAPAETEAERAAREAAEEDEDEQEYRAQRRDMPDVSGASAVGIVTINVSKKPAGKNEFFRAHPTFNPDVKLVDVEVGMEQQYFTATDQMETALASIGITMSWHTLYLTVSETGAVRVVPIRCLDEDGSQNEYNRTKEMAIIRGRDEWVRIYTDLKNKVYKIFPAPHGRFADPVWPKLKDSKIFRLAFRDKGHRIDSYQHSIYMKWAGRAADKK